MNVDKQAMPESATIESESIAAPDLLEQLRSLWSEVVLLSHERFHLAALETQQAGESLLIMIVAALLIGILLICAWLGLEAAAVLKLIEQGIVASRAILFAVVFNLVLVLMLFILIRRKRRHLMFPATRRSLQNSSGASSTREYSSGN